MTEADRRRLAELCGYKFNKSERGKIYDTYERGKKDDFEYIMVYDWNPDESIEQAMVVAEAMCKSGFYFEMCMYENLECSCNFSQDPKAGRHSSDNPASAICAAALAALGPAEKLPKNLPTLKERFLRDQLTRKLQNAANLKPLPSVNQG